MTRNERRVEKTVTLKAPEMAVAVMIAMMRDVYGSDIEHILKSVCAYFGYKAERF